MGTTKGRLVTGFAVVAVVAGFATAAMSAPSRTVTVCPRTSTEAVEVAFNFTGKAPETNIDVLLDPRNGRVHYANSAYSRGDALKYKGPPGECVRFRAQYKDRFDGHYPWNDTDLSAGPSRVADVRSPYGVAATLFVIAGTPPF